MQFITNRIDAVKAKDELAAIETALGVDPADPLARFRDEAGELVESEEFFAWVHRASVTGVLT